MALIFGSPGTRDTGDLSQFGASGTAGAGSTIGSSTTNPRHGARALRSVIATAGASEAWATAQGNGTYGSGRYSVWIYLSSVAPSVDTIIAIPATSNSTNDLIAIMLRTTGKLCILAGTTTVKKNGTTTLVAGVWYRVCLAWTITATNNWSAKLYVATANQAVATLECTMTNADVTLGGTNVDASQTGVNGATPDFGSVSASILTVDYDDLYIDNDNSQNDIGNMWATVKRPKANGTNNDYVTQIGSGGSGFGTGHSPQVNERPLSDTNGWSVVTTSSTTKNEQYNVERPDEGDDNIVNATLKAVAMWMRFKISNATSVTSSIMADGTVTSKTVTTAFANYRQNSPNPTTYPAGTGTDVGCRTVTATSSSRTASLGECGIVVFYIPPIAPAGLMINQAPQRAAVR